MGNYQRCQGGFPTWASVSWLWNNLTPGEQPTTVGKEHLKYGLRIAAVWYL